MKTLLRFALAFALLTAFSNSSYALIRVADLSADRARMMGIEVRSKASGPNHVRLEINFKREGALESFDPGRHGRVEMRLRDGDNSISRGKRTLIVAPLQIKQTEPGRVRVTLTARRDQVSRMSVMIHVMQDLSMAAFNLELKEFVDLKKIDRPVATRLKKAPTAGNARPAAADVKAN